MITPHKMNFNKNRPGPNRLSVGRRFSWGLIFSPHYFLPLTIRDFGEKLVKVLFHHNHSEAEQTFACIFSNCWERTKEVFDPVIGYTYYRLVNQTWTLLNFWLPFSSKKFDYIANSKKWSGLPPHKKLKYVPNVLKTVWLSFFCRCRQVTSLTLGWTSVVFAF